MQCAATGGGSCAVLNSQIKIFVEQVCPFVICEGSGHVLTFKNWPARHNYQPRDSGDPWSEAVTRSEPWQSLDLLNSGSFKHEVGCKTRPGTMRSTHFPQMLQ